MCSVESCTKETYSGVHMHRLMQCCEQSCVYVFVKVDTHDVMNAVCA